MVFIDSIEAYEVLDSRGNPTVKVEVLLSDFSKGSAIVPSGASTGKKEALELRDKDKRFKGKGVLKACENVNTSIANEIIGLSPYNQQEIDVVLGELDGSNNYSHLGANAVLGVSVAIARAAANSLKIPLYKYLGGANAVILPMPMLNIINGGVHADNLVDFQEYMIVPNGFDTFKEALRASSEIYHTLKKILSQEGYSISLGDEGGFAPNLDNNSQPVEYILRAIEEAGFRPYEEISLALDVASSEFYEDGFYNLKGEGKKLTSEELIEYYEELIKKYPIVSIEDGMSEEDWEGWEKLTEKLDTKVQLVGDDIFVTNSRILQEGIEKGIANAVLIKPNQIGTLSQTMECVRLAQQSGYKTIISHRSGESEDTLIADLSVALNAGQIKTGAPARGERTAKYNRLLEIERELLFGEYFGENMLL